MCVYILQTMRYLENSYDKVCMKCEEAKQVKRVYEDIKSRFEEVLFYSITSWHNFFLNT